MRSLVHNIVLISAVYLMLALVLSTLAKRLEASAHLREGSSQRRRKTQTYASAAPMPAL